MNRRKLGRTGISVGEIGLGAWQLGNPAWNMTDGDEALRMVEVALEQGCNFFDTAPGYGEGASERILGAALTGKREQAVVCSKFGHRADGSSDFSVSVMREALEESLRALRTDYVDVWLLHNPPGELLQANAPQYEELERLKGEGKIRSYGVSIDQLDELELVVGAGRCGVVEILFNIFHQSPLAGFKVALERGIGLIGKVPLDSGWLSGRYAANSKFSGIRKRWDERVIRRRAELVGKLQQLVPMDSTLREMALQYILAQAEISTVIPGARSVEQLRSNLDAGRSRLSPELAEIFHEFWRENLSLDPLPW